MAHELPLQAHGVPHTAPVSKTKKGKHHQAKILLPNGQKPDFGPGKERLPQLPNGAKPDFGTGEVPKKGKKSKKLGQNGALKAAGGQNQNKAQSNGNGPRNTNTNNNSKSNNNSNDNTANSPNGNSISIGNSNGNANGNRRNGSSGKNLDCYAGSSFHSSPEAVALPKPSFASASQSTSVSASSPPRNDPAGLPLQMQPVFHSPAPQQQLPFTHPSGQYNLNPAFVYQGVPGAGPPRYPITTYPPPPKQNYSYGGMMPGFMPPGPHMHHYQHYPMAPPPPPMPMASHQPPQNGQKILFNDLIGSSK